MKNQIPAIWLPLSVLLFASVAVKAADSPSLRPEDVVLRYFREVIDGRSSAVLEELFQQDCIMHRPETAVNGIEGIRVFFERARQSISEIHTEIHDIIASGDRVVVRLSHRAIGMGTFRSRLGIFDIKGKTYSWDAIAIFRLKGGKIAEEWVNRDELGILLSIGAIQRKEVSK